MDSIQGEDGGDTDSADEPLVLLVSGFKSNILVKGRKCCFVVVKQLISAKGFLLQASLFLFFFLSN